MKKLGSEFETPELLRIRLSAKKCIRRKRAKKLGISLEEYEERLKTKNTRRPITPEERLKLQNAIRLKWYHRKRAKELGMSLEEYESDGIYKRVETMVIMEEEELRKVNSNKRLQEINAKIQRVVEWFEENSITHPDYEAKCSELHCLEVKFYTRNESVNTSLSGGIEELSTFKIKSDGR